MPTTITTASLLNRINLILNQGTDTPAWVLMPYAGGTAVLNSASGLTRLLNDEKDYLCRQIFGLEATFSGAYAAADWAQRYDAFTVGTDGTNGSTTLTGGKLWWPRQASVNGVPLEFCSEETLRVNDAAYQSTAAQVPTNWYRRASNYVGVWPVPIGTIAVVVDGLYIPADFPADGSGGADWVDASLVELLIDGTCLRAINKVAMDAQMQERLGQIEARYAQGILSQAMKLPPYLRDGVDSPYKVATGGK